MKTFNQLKQNLKKDFGQFKKIKLALLGDSSTQLLMQSIRGMGFEYSLDLDIFEADFNQIDRQVFDPASELYASRPDIIIIFYSTQKLLARYNKLKPSEYGDFAASHIQHLAELHSTIKKNVNARVLLYNYPEINDSVFGNYANKQSSSFIFQLRKINFELMVLATENPDLFVIDISSIQNKVGRQSFFHPSVYVNTDMVLSIEVLPAIASRTLDLVSALYGGIKKCLVLDLDNTVWGGIIGDDGIENIQIGSLGIGKAFTELQYWIKKLKNRGTIITVCSKNTESVAKEPFEKHPDMVLRLDDIAVFIANWNNKVDNIRTIQSILNIGFDSMVFLDDNPFERNMVRENIPGITVPELPEDPAEYLEFLYDLNLFETVSYSGEDAERTRQYQVEAQRKQLESSFTNEEDFLRSLDMKSVVDSFNKFNIPRVAQLSQRSNQFNLRTVRYTEADIEAIAGSPEHYSFAFTLSDKFGDNGLICVVILKVQDQSTLFIDTWFMSCRVLKRGMEHFTLNQIADFAREKGYRYLKGEYIKTSKNEMVRDHFQKLGFRQDGDFWIMDVLQYTEQPNHITPVVVNMA